MTGPDRQPWWYSGDDVDPGESTPLPEGGVDEGGGSAGLDWTALVVGAQRVMEWAADRVMAPHADHGDPADHPQCVVCRTMVVIGESGVGRERAEPDASQEDAEPGAVDVAAHDSYEIQWIPIRETDR
jgi:hypothetical protein